MENLHEVIVQMQRRTDEKYGIDHVRNKQMITVEIYIELEMFYPNIIHESACARVDYIWIKHRQLIVY